MLGPAVTLSLEELAELIPLTVVTPARISTLGFLPDRLPGMLAFLDDARHLNAVRSNSCLAAMITSPELAGRIPQHLGLMVASEPRRRFFELQNALAERTDFYGRQAETVIHETARIHPRAEIACQDVRIGAGAKVESGAVVGPGTILGEGVVIQAGVVLGASGFQTYRGEDGFLEITHAGGLDVGDGTVIFANAVVARGVFRQSSRIGRHCRIGVNSFVSHNVEIGGMTFVGHGAVVNGNCRIGARAWIGPGAVLTHAIEIGEGAEVSLGSVVVADVKPGTRVSGNFAVAHQRLLRHVAGMGEFERLGNHKPPTPAGGFDGS